MLSTIYIIASVLAFFLELLPSTKLILESPALQVTGFDKDKRFKVMKVLIKIILVCEKINLGVCAMIFILKCVGVIPWW